METSFEQKEAWFLNPADSDENSALHIINIGHNTARLGYKMGPRVQNECTLMFITQGAIQLDYMDTSVQLQSGDLVCLMKEQRYVYQMTTVAGALPLRKIWFSFRGTQTDWLHKKLGLTADRPYLHQAIKPQSRMLLHTILQMMQTGKRPDSLMLIGLFYQLLGTVSRQHRPSLTIHSPEWVEAAKRFMDAHYHEPIDIEEVCKYVSVTRGHCSETFQMKYGISPSRYLRELRMERALHLIENTMFTITEIAYSVGYQSLFSFSRAFRNHFGLSPMVHREKNIVSGTPMQHSRTD